MTSNYRAGTVIQNANIITMDQGRPRAQAVAIGHGRFLAVGENNDVAGLIGPDTKVIDLGHSTVLPGFIDAHIHVLNSGIRHVTEAACDLPTVASVQNALRERADATPAGEWVRGFLYDDTKTTERRFLNRHDLDAVSTRHPIFVAHRAGHVFGVNTKAFEMAGITNDTPDPPGGRYGRDPATGELDGVVFERAGDAIRHGLLPEAAPADRRQGLTRICDMLTREGLTSVHDARVTAEELITYQEGRDAGDLSLRVYMLMFHPYFPALRDAGLKTGFGDDMLRLGGIKMVADGAIATRTAYLSEPYEGSEDDCGILAMDVDEIEPLVMDIHKAGFQVAVHANGDTAIEMVLAAYAKAQAAFPRNDPRHRIEHCTLVNPGILRQMKELGTVATPFCTYVYYHGEKMQFYGERRLQWMFAQRSFLDYGIIATGATDYPPGPYQPLMGIQSCVTRTDSDGKLWGPDQIISVEEALRIYTMHGAYASFEENLKGSIEVGKLADLVVLESDPVTIDPFAIKDIKVERTVVGGKTVYEA
jgi:predicted amidohydrolase YtcJ